MSNKLFSHYMEQLDEVSDDVLETNIHTALQLKRVASNIALSILDNDFLINSLDIDSDVREKISHIVKEAVSKRKKTAKKKKVKK